MADVPTVEPHVRTAEEVAAAMFRDEPVEDDDDQQARPKRPRPKNKNTTAHFPQTADDGTGKPFAVSAIHVAMAWIIGQVAARSMLNVRAAFQSDHWRSFLDCRIATETKRIHKHTDLLKEDTPLQLAC